MATTVEIISGYISIPNPVRQRDPFTVHFTFRADNWWPENFTYQVVGYDTAGTSFTIMYNGTVSYTHLTLPTNREV